MFEGHHHKHRENYNKELNAQPMGVGIDLFAERKDGSQFPVEISLSPVQIKGQKFVVAFIIDITVRKNIEVTVNEKQQELERVAAALITTNEGFERKNFLIVRRFCKKPFENWRSRRTN